MARVFALAFVAMFAMAGERTSTVYDDLAMHAGDHNVTNTLGSTAAASP